LWCLQFFETVRLAAAETSLTLINKKGPKNKSKRKSFLKQVLRESFSTRQVNINSTLDKIPKTVKENKEGLKDNLAR